MLFSISDLIPALLLILCFSIVATERTTKTKQKTNKPPQGKAWQGKGNPRQGKKILDTARKGEVGHGYVRQDQPGQARAWQGKARESEAIPRQAWQYQDHDKQGKARPAAATAAAIQQNTEDPFLSNSSSETHALPQPPPSTTTTTTAMTHRHEYHRRYDYRHRHRNRAATRSNPIPAVAETSAKGRWEGVEVPIL